MRKVRVLGAHVERTRRRRAKAGREQMLGKTTVDGLVVVRHQVAGEPALGVLLVRGLVDLGRQRGLKPAIAAGTGPVGAVAKARAYRNAANRAGWHSRRLANP